MKTKRIKINERQAEVIKKRLNEEGPLENVINELKQINETVNATYQIYMAKSVNQIIFENPSSDSEELNSTLELANETKSRGIESGADSNELESYYQKIESKVNAMQVLFEAIRRFRRVFAETKDVVKFEQIFKDIKQHQF